MTHNSRYFLEIVDDTMGYQATARMYMPLPYDDLDMVKCLKKWFKRVEPAFLRASANGLDIAVYAMMETEDGEIHNLSAVWDFQYMDNYEEAVGL